MISEIFEVASLSVVVLACWLGALGMLRMKEPTQALHYLSLPATLGASFLTIAVFISQGIGQALCKVLLIALILLAANSVDTHAMAQAFRRREIGYWEPRDDDPIEMVTEEKKG